MNTNTTRRFARYFALPVISAGIIAGALGVSLQTVLGAEHTAVGAAILAGEAHVPVTAFRGFESAMSTYESKSFECKGCANCCEVVSILKDEETVVGRFGDKCGKWSRESGDKTGNLGSQRDQSG